MKSPIGRPLFGRLGAAGIAAALCVAATVSRDTVGAASVWLVSFTIDGSYADGVNVMSDLGEATPGGWVPLRYEDWRLPSNPHPSPCVEAEPSPTGELHAVFNRKIDSVGTRCNPAGSDRQFRIRIDAASACTRIFDAYGPTAVNMYQNGTCELYYNDNPRVRVGRLFAKTTRTPVAFLTQMTNNSTSYEIRTDSDATITAIGTNQRLVTYMGTARLVEFKPGQKTGTVADPFNLKHQMTFTRYAQ
jgi:hypothetical protein